MLTRQMQDKGVPAPSGLVRLEFEVHGKVQRVHFRAHTKRRADELGLSGFCRNTPSSTVVGKVEGPSEKVAEFRKWLARGSPAARVDHVDIALLEPIGALSPEYAGSFLVDKSFGHAPRRAGIGNTPTAPLACASGAASQPLRNARKGGS